MKKYFVMSDIHSFFHQMLETLTNVGFDPANPDHILIICGDIFDRGSQSLELFDWLMCLNPEQLILIQGNHELLFFDLLEKSFPESHDYTNGTVRTFCNIAEVSDKMMNIHELYFEAHCAGKTVSQPELQLQLTHNWKRILKKVKNHPIVEWLRSAQWKNFYEIEPFIFVHSFIPLELKPECSNSYIKYFPTYQFTEDMLQPITDWRTKGHIKTYWDDAKWGCPWKLFNAGLFNEEIANGKRLVCGHWHTRDFHRKFEGDNSNNLEIFFSDNLIALDGCTAASGFCNVLVIDTASRKCFDRHNNCLGEY